MSDKYKYLTRQELIHEYLIPMECTISGIDEDRDNMKAQLKRKDEAIGKLMAGLKECAEHVTLVSGNYEYHLPASDIANKTIQEAETILGESQKEKP